MATPLGMDFGNTRFSSPDRKFRLVYIGRDLPTAIAETIVRGYLGYARQGETYPFPQKDRASTGYQWVKATDDQAHIIQFAHDLSFALSRTCIFSFNGAEYIPEPKRAFVPMAR